MPGTSQAAPAPEAIPTTTGTENGPAALRSDARRPDSFRVLVFTKTDGVRRASIPDGVATIRDLAKANGFQVTTTQDVVALGGFFRRLTRTRSTATTGTAPRSRP